MYTIAIDLETCERLLRHSKWLCTPARTLSISGLKSQVLKLPFLT